MLLFASVFFYMNFVRSVIPPQTGWWQYFAWRVNEGELPYKDFYFYLPPYFLMISSLLFKIFGINFMLYTIAGFLVTRILMWVLLYNILTRFVKPLYAVTGLLTGICVTASYLMDQTFDYNPLIMCIVVLQAFLLIKAYETSNRVGKYIYPTILGILSGCLLMLKQNVGIVIPIAIFICIILILYFKPIAKYDIIKSIALYIMGIIIGIVPPMVYIISNNIWSEFIQCITGALNAKTTGGNFIFTALKNFIHVDDLIIALFLLFIYLFIKKIDYKKSKPLLLLLATISCLMIGNLFYLNIDGFIGVVGKKKTLLLLFLLLLIVIISGIIGNKVTKSRIIQKYDKGAVLYLFPWIIFIVAFFNVGSLSNEAATNIYYNLNYRDVKTKILYISIYLLVFFWCSLGYQIFLRKNKFKIKIFIPLTALLMFLGVSFASAPLEELYAVIILSFLVSFLLQWIFPSCYLKNILVMYVCFILCVLSLSEKLILPYDWHSWTVPSLKEPDNPVVAADIKGLEGFRLPKSDQVTYKKLISLIEKNSTDKDVLYQFPNIPLFNVLTKRKTVYAAIPYFDVCPDDVAVKSAKDLRKNPPKLVLYPELSEARWQIHEDYFRNGNPSGQRKIQDFYNNVVKTSYRMLGKFDNNAYEQLYLWKRTAFNTGDCTGSFEIGNEDVLSQDVTFTNNSFDNIGLYLKNGNNLNETEVTFKLKEKNTNNEIFNNSYVIQNAKNEDYYMFNLNKQFTVKNNVKYVLEIKFDNPRQNPQVQLGSADRNHGLQLDVEKENMPYNICMSFE